MPGVRTNGEAFVAAGSTGPREGREPRWANAMHRPETDKNQGR